MASTKDLIRTLQQLLKQKKITYADLGDLIHLSESIVKRLFSKGDMSLSRLQLICEQLGLDISELAILAVERQRNVSRLTKAQELKLVENPKFLLFTYLLTVGWSVQEILASYQYTEIEAIGMLTRLDKMKLIELLPNNRVRLRVARDFQWRENGAITRFFSHQVQLEFFNAGFDSDEALHLVNNGYLSRASLASCQQKMRHLRREIDEMISADQKLDKQHLLPITHVTAIRPWVFSMFEGYRK